MKYPQRKILRVERARVSNSDFLTLLFFAQVLKRISLREVYKEFL